MAPDPNPETTLCRNSVLTLLKNRSLAEGKIFGYPALLEALKKHAAAEKRKSIAEGKTGVTKNAYNYLPGCEHLAWKDIANALPANANWHVLAMRDFEATPEFKQAEAAARARAAEEDRRLKAEAAAAAATMDVDEKQPSTEAVQDATNSFSFGLGGSSGASTAAALKPDAGQSRGFPFSSSSLATPKQSTTGGASLGARDIALTPTRRLFDITSSGIKTPVVPPTPSRYSALLLSANKLSIDDEPADAFSALTGATGLTEVTKTVLKGGFLDLDSFRDEAGVPESLQLFTTNATFASDQLHLIVKGDRTSAFQLLTACSGAGTYVFPEMKKLITSQREKHHDGIAQAKVKKEAAQHEVESGAEALAGVKSNQEVAKNSDVAEKATRAGQLAEDAELELANFQRKLKVKYESNIKELDAEFEERTLERAAALDDAANQQKINQKALDVACAEVTKREEVMAETVGLAQQHLDLMSAGTTLVANSERAYLDRGPNASEDPGLHADFVAYANQITAFNVKVDEIDRGAAGGGSA